MLENTYSGRVYRTPSLLAADSPWVVEKLPEELLVLGLFLWAYTARVHIVQPKSKSRHKQRVALYYLLYYPKKTKQIKVGHESETKCFTPTRHDTARRHGNGRSARRSWLTHQQTRRRRMTIDPAAELVRATRRAASACLPLLGYSSCLALPSENLDSHTTSRPHTITRCCCSADVAAKQRGGSRAEESPTTAPHRPPHPHSAHGHGRRPSSSSILPFHTIAAYI
jgi:hypothetical protein